MTRTIQKVKGFWAVALALVMGLALLPSVGLPKVQAEEFDGMAGDSIYWSLNTETGVLDIVGEGAMTNWGSRVPPWSEHIDFIKKVNISNGVTSIGSYAFSNCTSLTSVVIPDGVTSIGSYAFSNCTSLTSIVIPDGVTSIGDHAFRDCTSLTSIVIPDGVTLIDIAAFRGCTSLTSVVIPGSVTSIGSSAFSGVPDASTIFVPNQRISNLLDSSRIFYSGRIIVGVGVAVPPSEHIIVPAEYVPTLPEEKRFLGHSDYGLRFVASSLNLTNPSSSLVDDSNLSQVAYSLDGGIKWKKWPKAPSEPRSESDRAYSMYEAKLKAYERKMIGFCERLFKKETTLHLSYEVDEKGKPLTKGIDPTYTVKFPKIKAPPKKNAEKLKPVYNRDAGLWTLKPKTGERTGTYEWYSHPYKYSDGSKWPKTDNRGWFTGLVDWLSPPGKEKIIYYFRTPATAVEDGETVIYTPPSQQFKVTAKAPK